VPEKSFMQTPAVRVIHVTDSTTDIHHVILLGNTIHALFLHVVYIQASIVPCALPDVCIKIISVDLNV
jgi:hypothetical protein